MADNKFYTPGTWNIVYPTTTTTPVQQYVVSVGNTDATAVFPTRVSGADPNVERAQTLIDKIMARVKSETAIARIDYAWDGTLRITASTFKRNHTLPIAIEHVHGPDWEEHVKVGLYLCLNALGLTPEPEENELGELSP